MAFCTKCGKQLEEGSKFCPYCGQEIQSSNVENQKSMESSKTINDMLNSIQFDDSTTVENPKLAETKEMEQQKQEATINNKKNALFSVSGRISRKEYIIRIVLCLGLLVLGKGLSAISAIFMVLFVMGYIGIFTFTIRRCHDIEKSGWYSLINFIPFANIGFWIYLMYQKGTIGDNPYGPDPLQESVK